MNEQRHPPARFHDSFVVSRRINTATTRLATMLTEPAVAAAFADAAIDPAGSLLLDRFEVAGRRAAWVGDGHLLHRGRVLRRRTAIEIEISGWSSEASEVHIRPAARHPQRWGARRRRRYHHLAHLAADHIWRTLDRVEVPAVSTGRGYREEDAA